MTAKMTAGVAIFAAIGAALWIVDQSSHRALHMVAFALLATSLLFLSGRRYRASRYLGWIVPSILWSGLAVYAWIREGASFFAVLSALLAGWHAIEGIRALSKNNRPL